MNFPPQTVRDALQIHLMRAPNAPQIFVAFGRWNATASDLVPIIPFATGTGLSKTDAVDRCCGEMVENLSLGTDAHSNPVFAVPDGAYQLEKCDQRVIDLRSPTDLGSEGAASHLTMEQAIVSAVSERLERAAVADWWGGMGRPAQVLENSTLARQISSLRGASTTNETKLYVLQSPCNVHVCVALSRNRKDQYAIGTAAGQYLSQVALKAFQELVTAEISLLTIRQGHALTAEQERFLETSMKIADRKQDLFSSDTIALPESCGCNAYEALQQSGIPYGFADLTHPKLGLPTVRCFCPSLPRARGFISL